MRSQMLLLKIVPMVAAMALFMGLPSASNAQPSDAGSRARTLVVANTVEVPSFDPQWVLGIDAIAAVANLYDRLVYLDADSSIKPWLATSWTLSDDGRTWVFDLRKDARFHDGSPVTSAAVKFSFERAIGPNRPSSLAKTYLASIESIETPDVYTVKLTTREPFAPLLNHLGHQTAGAILNPAVVNAHGNDLSKAVDAGGGMYKLVSWSRNNELVIERDQAWWGPKPTYDRIVYKPVPQAATRIIMLEKGEVDVVTNVPGFEVPRLQKMSDLRVKSTESIRSMFFAFNMAKPPMNNVKVREAINRAVNIEGIVKALLNGFGARARSIITPNLPFYFAASDFKYDVAKAKSLLKEAGVAPGTRLVLVAPKGRYLMDSEVAQVVAGSLRDLGLDVDLRIIGDWAQYQQTVRGDDFHLAMNAWAPGSLDPDGTFRLVMHSTGAVNFGRYSSKAADALILAGSQSIDKKLRAENYRKLQDLLASDIPYLLLSNTMSFSATRATVCGVTVRSDEAVLIKDAKPC